MYIVYIISILRKRPRVLYNYLHGRGRFVFYCLIITDIIGHLVSRYDSRTNCHGNKPGPHMMCSCTRMLKITEGKNSSILCQLLEIRSNKASHVKWWGKFVTLYSCKGKSLIKFATSNSYNYTILVLTNSHLLLICCQENSRYVSENWASKQLIWGDLDCFRLASFVTFPPAKFLGCYVSFKINISFSTAAYRNLQYK